MIQTQKVVKAQKLFYDMKNEAAFFFSSEMPAL
jgi:hypothetical protein